MTSSTTHDTSLALRSAITSIGELCVTAVYPDGTRVDVGPPIPLNKVVLSGLLRMLSPLFSTSGSSAVISTLGVGIGGTIDPEGRFPKPVDTTLTSLFSQAATVPVIATVDETYPKVTFVADIPNDSCVGLSINEAALFFSDGVMFNIKTFASVPKTADFGLHFSWTVRLQ